jgi:hypothetical protein
MLNAPGNTLPGAEYDPFDAKAPAADPFEANVPKAAVFDPFERFPEAAPKAVRVGAANGPRRDLNSAARQVSLQNPAAGPTMEASPPVDAPLAKDSPRAAAKDPCAATTIEKPLFDLGIAIALPAGQLPTDHAAECWELLNSSAGPLAGARYWSEFGYLWDATCFCHRPLYFEEINLERYGYGCHPCLQPAASAAHFFATVPALPYLMAVDCPQECEYTLGHYRPGSCPPWRHHWPPCDGLAAAAQAGVLTGMIFLIP